jgi:hypothetical protein
VLVIALGIGGAARPAGAQDDIPVTLRARTFRYDRATRRLAAAGDVIVTYQDVTIYADRLEADLGTNDVRAEGRVRIEAGGHEVRGQTLEYNLTTRRGRLAQAAAEYTGPLVLGTISLRAERLDGTLGGVMSARQAFCTTCEGPDPVAFLTAREFTVYPNDKIVGRSVTVWIGGKRIVTWPYFVIYLRERRATRLLPVAGFSELEGYFLKTFYAYALSENQSGTLHVDLMERLGIGYGLEHYYRFGAAAGAVFFYWLDNKQVGGTDRRIAINHTQQLGDLTVRLYADGTTRTSPLAPSSDLFGSLDASWRTARTATTFYQTYSTLNFLGFTTSLYTARLIHSRQVSDRLWAEVVADASRVTSALGTDDEAFPRLALRYRGNGYTAALLAEGRLDLDGNAFVADARFVTERLPETTVVLDAQQVAGTRLVYQVQAGLGRFRETGAIGTLDAVRTDVAATISGPLFESDRDTLILRATVRGSHYTTGDVRGYVSGRVDFTRALGASLTGQVGYTLQNQAGRTPFTFDSLVGQIGQTDVTLTYRRPNVLLTAQAAFDNVTGTWLPAVARAQWAPREKWAIAAALQYEATLGIVSRGEVFVDVALDPRWQIVYYGFYDGFAGRLFHDRLTVARTWADCLVTAVTYRGVMQEVWFETWLTALPWVRGQVGIGSQGQVLFTQPWLSPGP